MPCALRNSGEPNRVPHPTHSQLPTAVHLLKKLRPRFQPLLVLLSLLLLLWQSTPVGHAQSSTSYWRYSTTLQLTHLIPSDIDQDSVQEFLLATIGGEIQLVNAEGIALWQFTTGSSILSLASLNVDGDANPGLEIVVGLENRLLLLSADGRLLWEQPLSAVRAPATLLLSSNLDEYETWRARHPARPIQIAPIDTNQDGHQEIAVLLASGQVQLFDAQGNGLWQYYQNSTPGLDTSAQMLVGDLNRDGREEIVLSFFRRFTLLTIIDGNGRPLWDQPIGISGRATAMTLIDIPQYSGVSIAVGTDRGTLTLYNVARQRVWPRTVNVPITSLAVAQQRSGPILLTGTAVGTVIAYNGDGERVWTATLDENASRPVASLSSIDFLPDDRLPVVSAILDTTSGGVPGDVFLLSSNGRTLNQLNDVNSVNLTQMTDINGDRNSELLLAQSARIELLGIGLGASETASEWQQSVNATPRSVLPIDLDIDGDEELLIGTENGRVHCFTQNATLCWLLAPGGIITHMAQMDTLPSFPPNIVIVRTVEINDPAEGRIIQSWLELWEANGEEVWETSFDVPITALMVENINNQGPAELVIGNERGEIRVFSSTQQLLWKSQLPDSISGVGVVNRAILQIFHTPHKHSGDLELLVATENALFKVSESSPSRQIASYPDTSIERVYLINQPGNELATRIVTVLKDGTIHGHNWDGVDLAQWPIDLGSPIIASQSASDLLADTFEEGGGDGFLISTEDNEVVRLTIQNNEPRIQWRQNDGEQALGFYWGDMDEDSLPDMAVGLANNRLRLYGNSAQEPTFVDQLDLSGDVFALVGMKQDEDLSNLVAITNNGDVVLFRAQENRPPLLTSPTVDVSNGGYNFGVSVADVENDEVLVTLETHNGTATGEWTSQGVRSTTGGRVIWTGVFMVDGGNIQYRFRFTDGGYSGTTAAVPVPVRINSSPLTGGSPVLNTLLGLVGLGTAVLLIRQWQLPSAKARRFYGRLQKQPARTLPWLETQYIRVGPESDFWLYLASQARQQQNERITNLADGLFLLADRPQAALPILRGAVEDAHQHDPEWLDLQRWLDIYQTCQILLEVPSITELALMRPQLVELLSKLEANNAWTPLFNVLLPILTNVRDSQRVDSAEDSLSYLNEAAYLLRELDYGLPEFSDRIEKTLTAVIAQRWSGMVSAEIEDLQGRAELDLTLKTRRIVPLDSITVVLELANNGRAAAESLQIQLMPNPAYEVLSPDQTLSLIAPGRVRELSFEIRPLVTDRFRITVEVTYDDRLQDQRKLAFGDMVHLLPPVREFSPIVNPYLPGTPLRPNSHIFFGREQIFHFIADNAGNWTQRNVMILIGQRRTGKTSMLLRLQEQLPTHLLPIYIDCQSLGVIPGMPALFNDIAWLISDALALRDIELEVPSLTAWEANPTGMFQREFLPQVRSLLPEGTMLLLLFDEFEAFENLVDDQILPPTFFTFLRHLMQHGEGLSFLFVGTRRLEEMSSDYWSVLFNIALYERIRYLNKSSALRLITEPVSPHLVYDDLALDKIWRVTAGHPYFLQLVCYTLVKQANISQNGYVTISDVNAGLAEMLSLGEMHFAYLWQRSSFAEQALLTAVAHLMDQDVAFYPDELVNYLEPYNIHLSPADVTRALTSLVERDILQEVSSGATVQYELRVGLVGLWVAKYKSMGKLQAVIQ